MGHSRKTDNYNLPLWDGGDKFTITGDLNHTHEIIDSTLKNNEDISTRASNLAADSSARVNDVSASVDTRIASATEDLNSTLSSALSTQNDTFNTKITGLESSVDGKITGLETSVDGKITGLETSVDANVKSLRDDMAQAVAGVPSKYLIDIVGDYGADPTGKTDTTPIFAQINVDNPDAYCIFFRPGTYLFNDTIRVDGSTRLVGSGSIRTASSGKAEYEHGGTFLDFRVPAGRQQCISFGAWGTCNIEHLTIGTKGETASAPFIRDSGKVLIIDDVSFCGPPSMNWDSCQQDAIILGVNGDVFAGYGTRINNVSFMRIRTCIKMGPGCNGTMVSNIVITGTCGTSDNAMGAIHLDGETDQCSANLIMNVIGEPHAYTCLVSLSKARGNQFYNLQTWDTTWGDPPLRFKNAINFITPNAIDNIFNNFWLDGLPVDKLASDMKYLTWGNSVNQVNYRSLPYKNGQQRIEANNAPTGSMCVNEGDGKPWINTGGAWHEIALVG